MVKPSKVKERRSLRFKRTTFKKSSRKLKLRKKMKRQRRRNNGLKMQQKRRQESKGVLNRKTHMHRIL